MTFAALSSQSTSCAYPWHPAPSCLSLSLSPTSVILEKEGGKVIRHKWGGESSSWLLSPWKSGQSSEPLRDSERTALGNICPENMIRFQLIKLDKHIAYCRRCWESSAAGKTWESRCFSMHIVFSVFLLTTCDASQHVATCSFLSWSSITKKTSGSYTNLFCFLILSRSITPDGMRWRSINGLPSNWRGDINSLPQCNLSLALNWCGGPAVCQRPWARWGTPCEASLPSFPQSAANAS